MARQSQMEEVLAVPPPRSSLGIFLKKGAPRLYGVGMGSGPGRARSQTLADATTEREVSLRAEGFL